MSGSASFELVLKWTYHRSLTAIFSLLRTEWDEDEREDRGEEGGWEEG